MKRSFWCLITFTAAANLIIDYKHASMESPGGSVDAAQLALLSEGERICANFTAQHFFLALILRLLREKRESMKERRDDGGRKSQGE